MKKVLILSILSIFLSNCTTDELSNTVTPNNEITLPSAVDKASNNNVAKPIKASTEITLSTVTRGFSSSTSIKDGKLTRNSTGVVPPTTIQISASKLYILKQKFEALNLVKIPTYNPTTCLRCEDRDLGQTLVIKHEGVTYTSKIYDSTNPPAAIKSFVLYINTIN
jgi:hypothetical protein